MGRDPALVNDEGGEILKVVEFDDYDHQPEIGQRFTLENGEPVEIIGLAETLADKAWTFTAIVGNA